MRAAAMAAAIAATNVAAAATTAAVVFTASANRPVFILWFPCRWFLVYKDLLGRHLFTVILQELKSATMIQEYRGIRKNYV
jgi:hypothetical protein